MGKNMFSSSLVLALAFATCYISLCPIVFAENQTTNPGNVVLRVSSHVLRDLGCLAPHNNARAAVKVSGLTWNTTLVASAQRWANKLRDNSCRLYHSNGNYGENLYKMWGAVPTCKTAVDSWVKEKAYYDYKKNKCASGKVCGHYTQIVWRNSKRVGCARSTCSVTNKIYIWVCQYDPPGNYYGERPY